MHHLIPKAISESATSISDEHTNISRFGTYSEARSGKTAAQLDADYGRVPRRVERAIVGGLEDFEAELAGVGKEAITARLLERMIGDTGGDGYERRGGRRRGNDNGNGMGMGMGDLLKYQMASSLLPTGQSNPAPVSSSRHSDGCQ